MGSPAVGGKAGVLILLHKCLAYDLLDHTLDTEGQCARNQLQLYGTYPDTRITM